MRKWFYVLELAAGHYYAGISNNILRRERQHRNGNGAAWTKLHPPIRLLFQRERDVADDREAEQIENEMTVRLMAEHGWRNVRGGFFCSLEEIELEKSLRAHGYWERVLHASFCGATPPEDWDVAARQAVDLALEFHEGGQTTTSRDALFRHLVGMSKHRYWTPELDPGLDEKFWGAQGLLRVILSLKVDRVVGYKLQDTYAVLDCGLMMGHRGEKPWGHLFLSACDAFRPTFRESQQQRVGQERTLRPRFKADHRYDSMVSVLFPEMRPHLRQGKPPDPNHT